MDYQTLKARHRLERDNHHVNLTLRVHRSLSWLQRAEQADDPDGRFVFLWIAFDSKKYRALTQCDMICRTSESSSVSDPTRERDIE
jgi:hypothetical protein